MSSNTPKRSAFAQHVMEGLTATQAYLSSRFIYDEKGSKLFQQIMSLDEYYLTRCEFEILKKNANQLRILFEGKNQKPFELIELGAGDGTKTKLLLEELVRSNVSFTYRPVDISKDILIELEQDLKKRYPSLLIDPIVTSYSEALSLLSSSNTDTRKVVLFMGSNLGNFSLLEAKNFCTNVASALRPDDLFMIGIDLRKNPRTIRAAYDDAQGVTAAFNKNLLYRLQRELNAEVNPEDWGFYPLYNPESGEVRSYLHPLKHPQRIRIPALEIDRLFEIGEVIHTEVSRKYNHQELDYLAEAMNCNRVLNLQDKRGYFLNTVFTKV